MTPLDNTTIADARVGQQISLGANSLADLAQRISVEHEACRAAFSSALDHAMTAGDLLLEAKALVRQQGGSWGGWLTQNCSISWRTVDYYMQLAKNRAFVEEHSQRVANLSLRAAIKLLPTKKRTSYSLKAAIEFLKDALSEKAEAAMLPYRYVFSAGWAYARGPLIFAGHPVSGIAGTFAAPARELNAALARMDTEPAVEVVDKTMTLRSGDLEIAIDLFEAAALEPVDGASAEPIPEKLHAALALAASFIGTDGTWQRSVQLKDGMIRASTSVHGIIVDVPGMMILSTSLERDAVSFLIGRDAPTGWIESEDDQLDFFCANGAFARCRMRSWPWPIGADEVFRCAAEAVENPVVIDDKFRAALASLGNFSEAVELTPDGLTATWDHAKITIRLPTGATTTSRWRLAELRDVAQVATAWNPDGQHPVAFSGDGLRGVIAKKRTEAEEAEIEPDEDGELDDPC